MRIPNDLKAAMFISAAVGGLELLLADEPASHTRRARKINGCIDRLMDLFAHYPAADNFDYIDFGRRLFDTIEREMNEMLGASAPLREKP